MSGNLSYAPRMLSSSSNRGSSVCRGPLENVAYEFVLASPAVSCMSFSDGSLVAVQLLFCGMLPQGFIQYSSEHSCVVTV